MRVFISHSGRTSLRVATALHEWLPYVVQAAKPFLSTNDIDAGTRWVDVVGDELIRAHYGIICVTRENLHAPWLHFEAGAVSKTLNARVTPFLFGVDPRIVEGPLQQFQWASYAATPEGHSGGRDDIFKMVRSINGCLEDKIAPDVLRGEFDVWWPKLQETLDGITPGDTAPIGNSVLYVIEDLARLPGTHKCKCVWWITPDPYRYALISPCKEVISDAVGRGVNYEFLVPDGNQDNLSEAALRQLGAGKPGTVDICKIPNERFKSLAATDYLILDPEDPSSLMVFLELPIRKRNFWINVEERAASGFVLRFRALLEESQRQKLNELPPSVAGISTDPKAAGSV